MNEDILESDHTTATSVARLLLSVATCGRIRLFTSRLNLLRADSTIAASNSLNWGT